ncbi:MAG: PTS sugar transporter subunit IIA [Simkaniaceae bacterium]|nr:PTS sugar transporter subunit IIA [Candidatus Sacchlamyda saccharinae]
MDLKIKDVAELLSVSETTIRRWLLDGKIPAYKLNKQYRFSRIEIENWMMEQKLSQQDTAELLPASGEKQIFPQPGNQQFSLYRALNRGGVLANVEGETKEEVIRASMPAISEKLRHDSDLLSELLLDRERLMPTAFNNGVAVPHTRECLQKVPFDLITIVFPEKPIEYGALDEKPVDVLFFLFATGDKIHLHLLAKIAHLSSNEEFLSFLRSHPEKNELLERVRQWEGSLNI